MVKTSVIILNWNGMNFIDACLTSLNKQTYKDFEVIMVDNNSSDGSVNYVKGKYPWVKVLGLDHNYGFSKGNNQGIKVAQGDFIALLNNDTEVDKEWLKELVKVLEECPDVGFCASKMLLIKQKDIIDNMGIGFSLGGLGYKIGCGIKDNKAIHASPKKIFGACAGAAIYRRTALDDVGLLDEDFVSNNEDIDLSFRLQLMGYKCSYVPAAIVYHWIGASEKKNLRSHTHKCHRNLEFVFIKNMPTPLIIKYGFFHITHSIFSVIQKALKGQGKEAVKAKLDFIKILPKIWNKRKKIQAMRKVSIKYIDSLIDKWIILNRIKQVFYGRN